jgi:hypothetical protein
MHGVTHLERGWIEKADYGTDDLAGKHVFVLSCRDMASQLSIPYILHAAGRAMPQSARLLSPMGEKAQLITRTSQSAFELEFSTLRTRIAPFNGSVYRSEEEPLRPGDKATSMLFEATVLEVANDQPSRLRFVFRQNLDDPSFIFMIAAESQLTRIELPRIGRSMTIPEAAGP